MHKTIINFAHKSILCENISSIPVTDDNILFQGQSDLPTLVQILSATFAESIPVYKRQPQQTQSYAPPTTGGSYRPPGGYQPPIPYNPPGARYPYPRQPQPQPPHPYHPGPPQQPTYSTTPYPSGHASMPMPVSGYNPPYPGHGGYQPQSTPPYPVPYQQVIIN